MHKQGVLIDLVIYFYVVTGICFFALADRDWRVPGVVRIRTRNIVLYLWYFVLVWGCGYTICVVM